VIDTTAAAVAQARLAPRRELTFSQKLKRDMPKYAILAPAVLLLLVFHYLPLYGIVLAFQDFNVFSGISGSPWVGFRHFLVFLNDPSYWRVMRNTVIINIYSLIFGFQFPIAFALLLNEIRAKWFKKITQTVSYLPHFISWVIAAGIVATILSPSSGLVNTVLAWFGKEPVYFLTKAEIFRPILIVSGIWKGFGMSSVYYIAALAGIDQQLYEAAVVDGAGRWRQAWHITLPGMRNIIIVLLVLALGNMFSIGFDQIFLLYNPTVYETGDVISTYTYRFGLEKAMYSFSAAIGLTQAVVNFLMIFGANRLSRKVAGWSLW
jgi:putative aldouronate transport system permease protein